MNNAPRAEKQLSFYGKLLAAPLSPETRKPLTFNQSVDDPTELRFVTFKTRSGCVVDIVVRASGKKEARKAAQEIVASGELCVGLRYVEVS
jgi:hypothetical protein